MNQLQYQKAWERRERVYTTRFAPLVRRALAKQWQQAAKSYEQRQVIEFDDDLMLYVYERIYKQITPKEVFIVLRSMEVEIGTKDIISAIARMFSLSDQPLTIRYIKELMEQYFDVFILERLRQVNDTTKKLIQEAIQFAIDTGITSPREVADFILKKSNDINPQRAVRIARTETITAANKAQLLTHEASPFEYEKAWLPVVDNKTRDGHIEQSPQVYINLWEDFSVTNSKGFKESMLAPGDSRATASNVVNCRCVMLYRIKKDANGRAIRKNKPI